jgi:UDP-N-acetylmuramoylalanine--D-glutamate ligase
MSGRFADARVLVIGAGVAGSGAARVLVAEGAEVRVSDARSEHELPEAETIRGAGAELIVGGHALAHLDGITLVVVSPGVPEDVPIVRWALERGTPVWGELELGARLAEVPYLAVTGTNGKTTTTGMVTACLRAAGIDATACGNIGRSFSLATTEGHEALVVECSSFQLEGQRSFHPRVSTLLNVAPDHLDRHGTADAYAAAKGKIFAAQGRGDVHVGNRDDPVAARISSAAECPVVWVRSGPPSEGEVGYRAGTLVSRLSKVAEVITDVGTDRPGERANAAAAAAVSLAFGVPAGAVAEGLTSFEHPPHRGEMVAEVDGVGFIDNSKATNVHAALAALRDVRDAVLIAGGVAKGVDLSPLRAASEHLAGVVAVGEAADQITKTFDEAVPTRTATTIEEATNVAFGMSRRPGVVLLAPACASWDMFRDYAERGDRFAAAARALGGDRDSA